MMITVLMKIVLGKHAKIMIVLKQILEFILRVSVQKVVRVKMNVQILILALGKNVIPLNKPVQLLKLKISQ